MHKFTGSGRVLLPDITVKEGEVIPGLMHPVSGGYKVSDIVPATAFNVDSSKVSRDLSEAIWAAPNCTEKFADVPPLGVKVLMGSVLDGATEYLKRYVKVSVEEEIDNVDKIARILKESGADVLVINLPTAAKKSSLVLCRSSFESRMWDS